jgi:methyl-accepting chemotaxis protein
MDQLLIRELTTGFIACLVASPPFFWVIQRVWGNGIIFHMAIWIAILADITFLFAFAIGRVGTTPTTLTISVLFFVPLYIGILHLINKRFVHPILDMIRVAQQVAQGNLSHTFQRSGQGEISQLAEALHDVITFQKEMTDLALRMASGDLSIDIRQRSPDDKLSEAFAWMLDAQRELILRMQKSIQDVSAASEQVLFASEHSQQATQQITGTIAQVAKSTSLQTEYIGQIRDLIEVQVGSVETIAQGATHQSDAVTAAENVLSNQVGVAMRQVSESLNTSHQAAYGAGAVAQQGAVAVGKTIERIRAMASAMEQVSRRVVEMGHRSQQIVAIVQTIDEIAERTNLLALNAAIEAARAGEQGRGFAVVADEVRKLAERSAKSAKEIGSLIAAVQETASQAVAAMEQSNREMEQGLGTADETQSSLDQIQRAVADVEKRMVGLGDAVSAISNGNQTLLSVMQRVSTIGEENTHASRGLADGSDGLLRATEELSAIAEENSAAAEQVAASTADVGSHDQLAASSAHNLRVMANDLSELIGQYILKADDDEESENPATLPAHSPELLPRAEWIPALQSANEHSYPAVQGNGVHRNGHG